MNLGEGERREAAQRRRFWRVLSGIGVAGGVTGFVYALVEDGIFTVATVPPAVVLGMVALVVLAFLYGTWRFFTSIDELELQDNLWSSTIGFYVYATLFPLWWLLSRLGLVGAPNDWAIFTLSLVCGAAAYAWRKWRAR